MSTFDNRKDGYETKFARDQDGEFKIQARRNKLLGEWAADQMRLEPERKAAYAMSIVNVGIDDPSDEGEIKKVLNDLQEMGITINEHAVKQEAYRLLEVARTQLASS